MALQALIAKKVGMTRMVDAAGRMVPVTLLQVDDQRVTKVLTKERDGYDAVQVGYYDKSEKHLAKADIGRLRKASVNENFARFAEFRLDKAVDGLQPGAEIDLGGLKDIPAVDVTGVTKGRGFEGAVSRWGSATGRMTHGSMYHRRPGSLGMRATPGRVFKNKAGPGHMGDVRCTVQNLIIMDIDEANKIIAIRGSVPGFNDGFLMVRPSIKLQTKKWAKKLKAK